jgi:hypothetical protein
LKPDLVDFFVDDTGARMNHNTDGDLTAVRELLQQMGIHLKERKPNDISASCSFSVKSEQVVLNQVQKTKIATACHP